MGLSSRPSTSSRLVGFEHFAFCSSHLTFHKFSRAALRLAYRLSRATIEKVKVQTEKCKMTLLGAMAGRTPTPTSNAEPILQRCV